MDDSRLLLRSIARYVKTWPDSWEVVCVSQPAVALKTLDEYAFDIVVSDLHMPDMDGVDLLKEVQRRHPEAIRILLSGNNDRTRATMATQAAHQFLDKGGSLQRLREALERARALRGIIADPVLRERLTGDNALVVAPLLFAQLTQTLDDADASFEEVASIIEQDPAMTARLLHVASSAFFALPRRAQDLREAIAFLGGDLVRALVLQAELFEGLPPGFRHLDVGELQRHSYTASLVARAIVSDLGVEPVAVIATLLHDVGLLVLASRMPERWVMAAERAKRLDEPLEIAERQILGSSHAEVGAFILGVWGLDDAIVDGVAFHHRQPTRAIEALGVEEVVQISSRLVHAPDAELDARILDVPGVREHLPRWRERARNH